ncbi:COG1361 S-layer family protein [Alkaliphilus peptidifermentans]|uniref:CARDB domain-containing protein n=1 Tax=Alkaliphilus peptidifermentans DSM 18978 TaxID=1120976 RepID=A0A1G5K3M9_9FIRM|nr:hypothetical protein [Alkaliphilus peptidifermentans]SCY95187.1 hypothetical protein SAMN03080606_03228 [Alkaliphilus peptidifermentans DSM 18978]
MKKILSFLLITVILSTQGLSFSFGNSKDFVIKDSYQVNEYHTRINTPIYKGDRFKQRFDITNNTGDTISNIRLVPDGTSSFAYFEVPEPIYKGSVADSDSFSITVDMLYFGGDNHFPFLLKYNEGGVEVTSPSYYSNITNVRDTSDTDPPATSKKDVPRLVIENLEIPSADAGESFDLDLTVKNSSNYFAKDIIVTLLLDEIENQPFAIEEANLRRSISSLSVNRSEEIMYKLRVKDTAAADTYAVKFKFDFVNSQGDIFSTTETIYVNVTNEKVQPKVMINRMRFSPEKLEAGGSTEMTVHLKNSGSLEAKNIHVSLVGLTNNGITVVNNTNNRYVKELKGGEDTIVFFDLHASARITDGNHPLTLKLKYEDTKNGTQSDEHIFFIPVGNELGRGPQIEIINIEAPTDGLDPNDSFLISFDVTNTGETTARNVRVSVDGKEVLLPKSQNIRVIQSLASNETRSQQFNFYVSSEASKQNHPLLIKVEYDEGTDGETQSIQQYVGINVDRSSSDNTTPKIIIDQYVFKPNIIKAGDNFDLSVSFLNTNATRSIKNIKVFLTADEETEKDGKTGNVFTPVNSSNTFYIDSIQPKSKVKKNLTLYAIPDAKAKTYTITANFEYEDSDGNKYEATELIGIPVVQPSRLEVSTISLPPEAFVGDSITIFLEFYNTGKVTLNNLMIKLEGEFETQSRQYFVGNLESGRSDYYDTYITPINPGLLEGNIIFSYEDSAGDYIEVIKELSINIMEMEQFPEDWMDFPPEFNDEPWFKIILKNKFVWALVIILIAVGGFLIRKRIKKKKGMEADEVY